MAEIPENIKNHLRVAVAMCALAHKPPAQSLQSHLIDLRARFPCRKCPEGTAAAEREWRDRAMSLEDEIKKLEEESARCRVELDLLRTRESTAVSQVSSKRPSNESSQATPRKRRKKAASAEKKPNTRPLTVDWTRVTEPLGLELRHPSVQNSLDILSSVRNLATLRETIPPKDPTETVTTKLLFVHIDRCLSSMTGLLSVALSPSSTHTQRKQASDGLSMLLPSVIAESLSMTAYASSNASSSPDDTPQFTRNLVGLFFDPIIRSFIPVSRSIFRSVPPRTPTPVSGPLSSRPSTPINENERGTVLQSQRHDIRPSLLATVQRTLDSLRFVRPDLAPVLCILTSLSVIPELRRLWFASTVGFSSQEVGSTQRKTNRNRTKEEKEAFEKQKMQDLADHDAAWYLLAILNLSFEPEISPISSPLVALLKMRLTHELTELARILCFTDCAGRTRTVRTGSGPSLVEEEMTLGVYERAWLNGWLNGPTYPDAKDLTGGPERGVDVGERENSVGESTEVQE